MLADPTGKRQVARSGVTVGVLSRSRPGRACRRGLGAEAAGRRGFLTPEEPLKNGGRLLYVGAGGGAGAAGGGGGGGGGRGRGGRRRGRGGRRRGRGGRRRLAPPGAGSSWPPRRWTPPTRRPRCRLG